MTMKQKTFSVLLICLISIRCASSGKKLQQLKENDPQYQYNLGLFYLNSLRGGNVDEVIRSNDSSIDEAIKYFNRSLSLNPRYYLALNGLGLAYSMRGNLQESANAYQKCLEINPLFTEARNNLGSIYQEMGFLDKAEEEFKKAIVDQNYASRELPLYNLARLYFTQDRFEEALGYLQKSIQINNRLAMAHNLQGLILEKLTRLPEAISSYEQAIKIFPEEINFNFNLAVALFKNNELSKAAEIFERILPKAQDPEMKAKIEQYLKAIKGEEKIKSPLSTPANIFSDLE